MNRVVEMRVDEVSPKYLVGDWQWGESCTDHDYLKQTRGFYKYISLLLVISVIENKQLLHLSRDDALAHLAHLA